ncbi:MAG: class E sortase [Bifidobacteriaceae bacterium]|jgi:LPXTG-site transpeptidase (sortase) family protein|nr:class E sortase [Bifidobacteriaceae bacterium]
MNKTDKPPKKFILSLFSRIFLILAGIVLLYIIWLIVWSGINSANIQERALQQANLTRPLDISHPCPEYRDNYPELASVPDGQIIGQIFVPKFGKEYWRTLFQGSDKQMLDTMGFGHYDNSAMPGGIGNFSAAAHRNGYGASLEDIDKISKDDFIVIRTHDYWFVYKATTSEIVQPDDTGGILPVPYQPSEMASERLLTFTTCHPKYSTDQRYIQHAKIDYWAKASEGVPKVLLDAGVLL